MDVPGGGGGILSSLALSDQSNEGLAGCHPVSFSDQHFGHPKPGSVEIMIASSAATKEPA